MHFWREYFLTPDEPTDDLLCRSFSLPNDPLWLAQFMGALWSLTRPENWKQFGTVTPDEAAQAYTDIIDAALPGTLNECPSGDVPAPYWEDGNEADDVLPADEQIWYGYVSEGNFIEDVGIFLVSNFLASAISEKAAILYATNERKIRLSFFNGGGIPGVVKVYANEILTSVVNLSGDTDEVIDVDVITGYTDEAVEILQILDEV